MRAAIGVHAERRKNSSNPQLEVGGLVSVSRNRFYRPSTATDNDLSALDSSLCPQMIEKRRRSEWWKGQNRERRWNIKSPLAGEAVLWVFLLRSVCT